MSAVGKWVAGIISAVLIAFLSAWAIGLLHPSGGSTAEPSTPPPASRPTGSRGHPSSAAEIYSNRDSGPAGTEVKVSGQGFGPGEAVTIRFHTVTVAHTTAGEQGTFDAVACSVPADWRFQGQFSFVATGEDSIRSAEREFRVT